MSYDRAVLDFRFWQKARDTAGLYFVSRPKSNTNLVRGGLLPFERADPVNAGVLSDEQGAPEGTGKLIRRITWLDPDTGGQWQFLTNEPEQSGDSRRQMTLAPGLIVLIYRRRRDIEPERRGDSRPLSFQAGRQKAFDEFKNKLHGKKSRASSVAAKAAQANFMCLTHNLIVLHNAELEKAGLCNEAETKRRGQRLSERTREVIQAERPMPSIISGVQWATQRSVKLIRWIRSLIWTNIPLPQMHASLRQLYAEL